MKRGARGHASLRRRIEEILREECEPREGYEALLEACAALLPEEALEQLSRAPVEADGEQLAHWLVAQLESERASDDSLPFQIVLEAWRGRVDAADLELRGGDARAGSGVLARITRTVRWDGREESANERGSPPAPDELELGELLVLGYAGLALRAALERVSDQLLFGEHTSRTVTVELPGRALLELGRIGRAGWDDSSTALRQAL